MKRISIIVIVVSALNIGFITANPLPECEIRYIRAFPPEIGIYFNLEMDLSGDTLYTISGIAIIDSGVVGLENEFLILDSTNTSGFILNPECDSVSYLYDWGLDFVKYGTFGYAPPPIPGHSINLVPYDPWQAYVWSFDFTSPDWGETDIVINEINSHGTWGESSNFVELYNVSDTAISLDGWRVVCDTTYDLPSEAAILPHGFYTIDDIDFPANFDMDFDADNIYLVSNDDRLVDQVGWSSDHGENVSFMRYPDGDCENRFMGYNDSTSFSFENGFPSRGAPNRHESPGFVVIGTRAVGGQSTVDLRWTDPIWEIEFDISVAVRSETRFPETPDDGVIVYEGDAQHVTDTEDLYPGQWYYYTVFARDLSGEFSIPTYESRDSVMLSGSGVIEDAKLPDRISYLISYPNPFNATTTLQYSLLQSSGVTIEIYNIVGQRVATLFDGIQQAGEHSITWDAIDFPSGVYFARLKAGGRSENIKMVLLK